MTLEQFQTKLQQRLLNQTPPSEGDSLGLAIYHNAYRCRLTDTLKDTFERVYKLLGRKRFDTLCAEFIESNTNTHYSLAEYGADFAHWLRINDSENTAELAKLDWAIHQCFTGKDSKVLTHLDLTQLSEHDWEHIVFIPTPTAKLISSTKGAFDCWGTLEQGHSKAPSEALNEGKVSVLIWRQGLSPMMRQLNLQEVKATKGLLFGQCFSAICENMKEDLGNEAERQAGELLVRWLSDGLIAGYRLTTLQTA